MFDGSDGESERGARLFTVPRGSAQLGCAAWGPRRSPRAGRSAASRAGRSAASRAGRSAASRAGRSAASRAARPAAYSDAGVFTQMYSVTSLLGLATRWGVELAKKIESPGSRK
jgi:hypothetical protein